MHVWNTRLCTWWRPNIRYTTPSPALILIHAPVHTGGAGVFPYQKICVWCVWLHQRRVARKTTVTHQQCTFHDILRPRGITEKALTSPGWHLGPEWDILYHGECAENTRSDWWRWKNPSCIQYVPCILYVHDYSLKRNPVFIPGLQIATPCRSPRRLIPTGKVFFKRRSDLLINSDVMYINPCRDPFRRDLACLTRH